MDDMRIILNVSPADPPQSASSPLCGPHHDDSDKRRHSEKLLSCHQTGHWSAKHDDQHKSFQQNGITATMTPVLAT
jgi:hypothetical protein